MHGGLLSLDLSDTTLGDNDLAWRYLVEARRKGSRLRFGQAQPNPGTRRAGSNLIGQDTDLRGPVRSNRSFIISS